MFVDAAAELGIGGISLLLLLLYITLQSSLRLQREFGAKNYPKSLPYHMTLAAFASIITYSVGGMFQSVLYYPMLYFIIGMAVASNKITEEALAK